MEIILIVILVILMTVLALLIWLVLFYAEAIYKFLGKNGSLIITKIAAILIAAIAVQFIRQGIVDLIKMTMGGS